MPLFHAIALALAGRAKDAIQSMRRGLELEPGFRIRIFSEFGMAPTVRSANYNAVILRLANQ